MVNSVGRVPDRAEVIPVRQYSYADMQGRTKSFLASTKEVFRLPTDRGDWVQKKYRTLINLPQGSRAVVYHASGAMKLVSGLPPMESIFSKIEERETLKKIINQKALHLDLKRWVGKNESIEFERVWQIKAQAENREGESSKPVLCRAIGAYRHMVKGLPVWGPASVAIKIAANGVLDSLKFQIRETIGEAVDNPKILSPSRAAGAISQQLSNLMGKSEISIDEAAQPQWMRFGYMNLSKRKTQRFLAPVYVAAIEINNKYEAQAYLFVVPATEKTYQSLGIEGKEAPPANPRQPV